MDPIAGALCFYLLKSHAFMDGNKRTAAITATLFMNKHGWDLVYSFDVEQDTNNLADIIDRCAASNNILFFENALLVWILRKA